MIAAPLAARLFEGDVQLEETETFPGLETLLLAEQRAVANAAPQRQREFAAGRWCARRALARIGFAGAPMLVGPNREPLWPAGAVGSITHTRSYCAAAVGLARDVLSLGLDAEPAAPLDPHLIESVCTPRELRWLARRNAADAGLLARVLFSAKEAYFKYQFPLTRRYLEFHDVELDLDPDGGRFSVALADGAAPGASAPTGRFAVLPHLILTGIASPARSG